MGDPELAEAGEIIVEGEPMTVWLPDGLTLDLVLADELWGGAVKSDDIEAPPF